MSFFSEIDPNRSQRRPKVSVRFERTFQLSWTNRANSVCLVSFRKSVGTPVRGGLSYREGHLAMELVAESGLLASLEIVEVKPILDRAHQTAELAGEIAASALGARIL